MAGGRGTHWGLLGQNRSTRRAEDTPHWSWHFPDGDSSRLVRAPTWDRALHPFHPTCVQPFHRAPQIGKQASNHILRQEEKAFPQADAERLLEIPWSLLLLQTMTAACPHGRWLAEWPLHLSKVRGSILSSSKHGVCTNNISITWALARDKEPWSVPPPSTHTHTY